MHYKPVDHPPFSVPGPWVATRKRWEKEGLPEGADLFEYFDIPPFRFRSVAIETIFDPPFKEVVLEEQEEFVISINRRGVKVRNFKDETSMPEFLEYPVKGRESLGWLREKLDPNSPGRVADNWLEEARRMREEEDTVVFCNGGMYFAFLNEHMGTERLMVTYYDDPDFVHEVNDMLCTLCEKALTTALPKFKLDCIAYHEDMAYKNGSIISPALFREFMTPYYKRIQQIADKFDVDVQYMDSDGNITELIPLWLDCGINMQAPMEVASGMDVVRLRKEFGRKLRMGGGFDKRILASGKDDIKRELERIRPVIEDGGYIPGIDHGVPPDVSWENAVFYVETLKGIYGMK
jgi:uroporphyrinogen decarboxylase